ncbi:class I SAM-dependent methyltransferase [Actinophytocola sp.]|uniref:class I SAM-dependent methyltransferase n=1 Tax=Actinophytocola sp. TaxID=1872138 RepID=UPI002ED5E377
MIYQHPLAYLLGIEGIGLLRAFRGEFDREFVAARLAEVRTLLDDESLVHAGVEVDRVGTVDGYRMWSATYDDPGNAAFDIDMPMVKDILDELPTGAALDAACGTGRLTRELADRGHQVIGVDSSPDMLVLARERVPDGEFLAGDLRALPVPDDHVDLVVCGLALSHVPELGPVMAEFARVLRPGGHLVITDMHPESLLRGAVPAVRDQDGRPGRLVSHRHLVGDYLRAALAAGLVPRRCEEPVSAGAPGDAADEPGPWELWPWSLAALVPEAAHAANAGVPVMMIWDFQLDE